MHAGQIRVVNFLGQTPEFSARVSSCAERLLWDGSVFVFFVRVVSFQEQALYMLRFYTQLQVDIKNYRNIHVCMHVCMYVHSLYCTGSRHHHEQCCANCSERTRRRVSC